MTRARAHLLLLAVAAALAGCGTRSRPAPGVAQGRIDERRGAYREVALGNRRATVVGRLGDPLHRSDSPYMDAADAPPFVPADTLFDTVYPDVNFTYVKDRVASFSVYGRGAATLLGVRAGDPLASVRGAYGNVRCLARRRGRNPEDPGCEVAAGPDRFLYFSGDPIAVIAMSTQPPIPQLPPPAVSPALGGAGPVAGTRRRPARRAPRRRTG